MSLPGFFWWCALWEEDIQLLMLGFPEVLTLNKSPPSTLGLVCKAHTGISLLHQFRA